MSAGALEAVDSPATAARSRARRRAIAVTAAVAVLLVAASAVAMLAGDYPLSPAGVVRAMTGAGSAVDQAIVLLIRLPRLAMGALCGAALGLSGALLQSVLRNPLASPDLLGISGGASVGAVWATLVAGLSGASVAGAACLGAAAVGAVLLLASRTLSDGGYRLILAGVAVAFLCAAIIGFLLTRAQVQLAQSAMIWITGSLSATRWSDVLVVAATVAVALPAVVIAGRTLPVLALGDAVAGGLGTRPAAARAGVVAIAALLAAVATSFIGPVGFIALCAPPVARGLLGRGRTGLGVSAVVGAALLVVADLIAQYAIPHVAVPVGVVTGIVGAPYLLLLLITSKGRRA